MLKQLAAMAVIPPSPNIKACNTRATVTDIIAAQGPRTIPIIAAPTACPVLPPGMGRLNIMITKEKAAERASRGTCLDLSSLLSRLPA